MRFEWDPKKAALNLKKHGVSFETATEAFSDPNQVVMENYFYREDQEQRWQIIGLTEGVMLLLVVFVEHSEEGEEVIRLIYARKAEAYERSIYEDQFAEARQDQ